MVESVAPTGVRLPANERHIVHFVLALTSAVDDANGKRNHGSNNL